MNFVEKLLAATRKNRSLVCVGLDSDPAKIPEGLSVLEFNKAIIDATRDLVCCYKPQFAHYASQGAEAELKKTIDYIHDQKLPVLLDGKRGDVHTVTSVVSPT